MFFSHPYQSILWATTEVSYAQILGECTKAMEEVGHGLMTAMRARHTPGWPEASGYDRTKICGILTLHNPTTLLLWPRDKDISISHHMWDLYLFLSSGREWIISICTFIGSWIFICCMWYFSFKTRKMAPLSQKGSWLTFFILFPWHKERH